MRKFLNALLAFVIKKYKFSFLALNPLTSSRKEVRSSNKSPGRTMNLNIDKKRNDYASLSSKLSQSKNLDFTTYYK